MLVNLSNHPSQQWCDSQLEAAKCLAGPVVDLAFPYVPAGADSEAVIALAMPFVRLVMDMAPTAVLVQGEFTFTHFVVNSLTRAGIRCVSATSRRHPTQTREADGFQFVRFRDYVQAQREIGN